MHGCVNQQSVIPLGSPIEIYTVTSPYSVQQRVLFTVTINDKKKSIPYFFSEPCLNFYFSVYPAIYSTEKKQ